MQMLDTVAITLKSNEFTITDPSKFSPSAEILMASRNVKGRIACTQYIKQDGCYYPRLTLSRIPAQHGIIISLRIEASLPKLVYGNNFDELANADLSKVISLLFCRLREMGIKTSQEVLLKAGVSAIHYSKNIKLGKYATCSMVITELQKANITKRLDINRTVFINGGIAVKYHANSYEIAVYDKWADLQQAKISPKRGIENDYNMRHLPEDRNEILRLEIRLVKRTSLKAVLKIIGWTGSLTLEELFSETLSQKKILLHYWRQIMAAWDVLAIAENQPEDVFRALRKASPKLKPLKAFQLTGALLIARSIGIRGLRVMLHGTSDRAWQGLRKQIEGMELQSGNKLMAINEITDALKSFQLIKSSERFQYALDNNKKNDGRRSNFVDG